MAHAGTPSDLAARPAISGPSGHSGLWQALLVVAITVAVVMATSFIVASKAAIGGPTDRGYDQIEQLRGGANFSAASADRSYDRIEQLRGGLTFVDPLSDDFQTLRGTIRGTTLVTGLTVDHRYDDVQSLKGNLRGTSPATGTTIDHRYDDVQSLKGNLR